MEEDKCVAVDNCPYLMKEFLGFITRKLLLKVSGDNRPTGPSFPSLYWQKFMASVSNSILKQHYSLITQREILNYKHFLEIFSIVRTHYERNCV